MEYLEDMSQIIENNDHWSLTVDRPTVIRSPRVSSRKILYILIGVHLRPRLGGVEDFPPSPPFSKGNALGRG